MIASFLAAQIPGAAVGFVIGAFTPAIGRKIKSFFVKETKAAETGVKTEVVTIGTDIKKKI